MQNRRGLIFIGLALALGVTAAWITGSFVSDPAPVDAKPQTVSVVIVRTDVPIATPLNRSLLRVVDWPIDFVPPRALTSEDQAIGRIARRPLAGGEPLLETSLFDVGAYGGLRAVITPEYRAVSVRVDNVIGLAGFVTPGARVDVLATLRRVDLPQSLPYTNMILQDIRVLAVDQKLEEVKSGAPEVVSVVTLEVTSEQAKHLAYASHEGRLQLAMRSPGDFERVETESVGVVDVLGVRRSAVTRPAKPRVRTVVQVVSGTQLGSRRF